MKQWRAKPIKGSSYSGCRSVQAHVPHAAPVSSLKRLAPLDTDPIVNHFAIVVKIQHA
jgi:hypothetical protein